MEIRASAAASGGAAALCCFLLAVSSMPASAAAHVHFGLRSASEKVGLGGGNFPSWTDADGLLKVAPAEGPSAMAPDSRFPLVLTAKRTRRPDVLNRFRMYRGGWDITNKHYWASVGFTGAAGFVLAFLWFIFFALAFGSFHCCKWGTGIKSKVPLNMKCICLLLLLVFTIAASLTGNRLYDVVVWFVIWFSRTGCILLSVGQDNFHGEVLNTLDFVVNQSDFTVQVLRNVTGYLSFAKTINVEDVYLPSNVRNQIDKLDVGLNNTASTLTEKTSENSGKIKRVIDDVRFMLIIIAALMLLLAILGFALSILGQKHAIYVFIMGGWLFVAVTFILCGVFIILNNAVTDTCTAMDEWVQYPQAETALNNILPCVDEQTTNLTLRRSKEVIHQLVNIVNTAIQMVANANSKSWSKGYSYNQSGPLMPLLCSPYDSKLRDVPCKPYEVSFNNAPKVWQNYTCVASDSGSCVTVGRVTPKLYKQFLVVVNLSYALDHYTPLLLSLQDCNFVRETFTSITADYCPFLEHDLRLVIAGLALITTGVIPCLILWLLYTDRLRREGVFETEAKALAGSNLSSITVEVPL